MAGPLRFEVGDLPGGHAEPKGSPMAPRLAKVVAAVTDVVQLLQTVDPPHTGPNLSWSPCVPIFPARGDYPSLPFLSRFSRLPLRRKEKRYECEIGVTPCGANSGTSRFVFGPDRKGGWA